MISVLIADDQVLIRQAVAGILDIHDDIEVIGQATNGAEAVTLTEELHPDVVLMDIRMPHLDGIEATRKICASPDNAATKVLILTTFEEDEYVLAALRAGASGFIGKGAEPDEIIAAIAAVHQGGLTALAQGDEKSDHPVHARARPRCAEQGGSRTP